MPMKTFKITLLIISLVGIGFIAGFYTNRFLVKQKINRVANMRYADGLKQSLFEKISATEEQRKQISPAIEKYADKIATRYIDFRVERHDSMDSLRASIKPFLNEKQKEELETFCDRYYYYSHKTYQPKSADNQ
jgi:Na+-translocating ferredoxin:NAD+ oxidoreductase RnfG subunit